MARIYDQRRRVWVDAEYDPVTNSYFDSDGRSLGSRETEHTYGTAIERREVDYDSTTNKYYRNRDGVAVADGPDDD
jgi:hypothetical protein